MVQVSGKRSGNRVTAVLSTDHRSVGVTIHRNAGVSLIGFPREGGTSILWGEVGHRVKTKARDLRRRFDVGSAIVAIGSDF